MHTQCYLHIAEAIQWPALIQLTDNLYIARFEVMKTASALHAVKCLLDNGTIKKGDTLIDSSSGTYAYALALACHQYGLNCHIITSDAMDKHLCLQLTLLGAKVEYMEVEAKFSQQARIARIQSITQNKSDIYWMQQYHNATHSVGYYPIANHIWQILQPSALSIVGGVGTGSSTGGLITQLRQYDTKVELIGVEPFGSTTFAVTAISDPEIHLAGLGSSISCQNTQHMLYDHIHWVAFEYGVAGTLALFKRHAIFAGLSTGLSYLVARYEAARCPNKQYLIIGADSGYRYMTSVYQSEQSPIEIDRLVPKKIQTLDELVLPWSAFHWQRRTKSIEPSLAR